MMDSSFLPLYPEPFVLKFIKIAPENPVLWTGMKGVSAESRKKQANC